MIRRSTNRTTAALLSTATLAAAGLMAVPVGANATSAAPTAVVSAATPTAAAQAAPIPTYAAGYADDFIRAWGRGDRARMALLATSNVTAALPGSGGRYWSRTAVDAGFGKVYVSYRNTVTGDKLTLLVINELAGEGRPDAIQQVSYTSYPLPHNATAYADQLVRNWGVGAVHSEHRYATDSVVATLGPAGGPHWARVSADGAAGSVYVTYRNTVTHRRLVLQVNNMLAGTGAPHAVIGATFHSR